MFDGEFASLLKLSETGTVKVPNPIKVFENKGYCYIVMDYLEMHSLDNYAKRE